MNTIREITKINEEELQRGIAGTSASWHARYAKSPWIYAGNLDHGMTEGDVLAVLSQWGEIEDLSLAREEATGRSRGFAFCKYEDARSCVLAVDNMTGVRLCGRSLRVDHVENYRLPKNLMEKEEEETAGSRVMPGHAYAGQELASDFDLQKGHDLFAPPPAASEPVRDATQEANDKDRKAAKTRRKEERRKKREEKEQRRREREQKKMEREERRRERRARHVQEGEDEEEERHHKKRKRHKKDRSDENRPKDDGSKSSRQRYDSESDDEKRSHSRHKQKKKEREQLSAQGTQG
jgi:RNA-binding motif X-linked protein 2